MPEDDLLTIEIIEELEFGIRAENEGGKATWVECFSSRNMLWKRTINGMMLQFIQQLNGQNFYCTLHTSYALLAADSRDSQTTTATPSSRVRVPRTSWHSHS